MLHVTNAEYVKDYCVRIEFNNSECGIANFSNVLNGTVFLPLREVAYSRSFRIEGNTVSWKNGADFAPEYLLQLVRSEKGAEQTVPPESRSAGF